MRLADASPSAITSLSAVCGRDGHLHYGVAGLASFEVDLEIRTISVSCAPETPPSMVTHLLVDHALPRVAGHLGYCLHGAAVAIGEAAIVLLGPSGAGKSTLAARLALSGALLIGDDCVFVDERGAARPTFRRSRVWPDALEVLGLRYGNPDDTGKVELSEEHGIGLATSPIPIVGAALIGERHRTLGLAEALELLFTQRFAFVQHPPESAISSAADFLERVGPIREVPRSVDLFELARIWGLR